MKYVESGEDYSHSVAYTYDLMNNLTGVVETINGTEFTSTYGYNTDNVLTSVTNGAGSWNFGYDTYGRLSNINGSVFNRNYNYKSVSTTKLTAQLSSLSYPSLPAEQTHAYTYDDNGNIVSVSYGDYSISYAYDSQNQLIRENNSRLGRTYTWTYDNAGNILSRSTYAYTTGELGEPTATIQYRYEDADWGDLLTGINNNTITYDEIGNMVTFGARTFTWEHGRQLASQTVNGSTWTYTYNADGMRTGRTNGTNTYKYVYDGSQLIQMTRNGVEVNFSYINGIPATISFDGMTFYYVVNGQGDITGIVDNTGKVQLRYYYDAWGVSTSVYSDDAVYGLSLATINPLRYRGYVFDWEVGLYYLQSRYYIPEIGRFLNADTIIDTGDFLGYNLFVYCDNSPANKVDYLGLDGKTVELGKGWYFRIDPADTSTGTKRHIHIWNKKKSVEYIQNDDGSPHDKHKGESGKLPKWLNSTIKTAKGSNGWDYNGKRNSFFEDTQISVNEVYASYTFADKSTARKEVGFFGRIDSSIDGLESIYRKSDTPSKVTGNSTSKLFVLPIFSFFRFALPSFGFSWVLGFWPVPSFG